VLLAWHDRAMTQLCMRGDCSQGSRRSCCRGVIRKNSIIQLGEWPSISQRCVTAWYDKVRYDSA
jgi:hypothetical protein